MILYLGPERAEITGCLESFGDTVICTEDPVLPDLEIVERSDFLVSYGFRHIIGKEVLDIYGWRAINLHISLLPWNRGADPNLWSFLENTPKGVSIHLLDEGIDTGDIIIQREVAFTGEETLRTSYEKLVNAMNQLFVESWETIRGGGITPEPQPAGGTMHYLKDKARFEPFLTRGWDTPVKDLIGKALEKS